MKHALLVVLSTLALLVVLTGGLAAQEVVSTQWNGTAVATTAASDPSPGAPRARMSFGDPPCWWCDRCSEEELFVSPNEIIGGEKIAGLAEQGIPECVETTNDCTDLLECDGPGGGTEDAEEEEQEQLASIQLTELLEHRRWIDARELAARWPGITAVVPARNLVLVHGKNCPGGVYSATEVPVDVLRDLQAIQQ